MEEECTCEFDPAPEGEDPELYYHYRRTCPNCNQSVLSLHCEHDGVQTPCVNCGVRLPSKRKLTAIEQIHKSICEIRRTTFQEPRELAISRDLYNAAYQEARLGHTYHGMTDWPLNPPPTCKIFGVDITPFDVS